MEVVEAKDGDALILFDSPVRNTGTSPPYTVRAPRSVGNVVYSVLFPLLLGGLTRISEHLAWSSLLCFHIHILLYLPEWAFVVGTHCLIDGFYVCRVEVAFPPEQLVVCHLFGWRERSLCISDVAS